MTSVRVPDAAQHASDATQAGTYYEEVPALRSGVARRTTCGTREVEIF